ncbi:hypothetical protein ACU6TU_13520 [Halomonas sp. LS-001]
MFNNVLNKALIIMAAFTLLGCGQEEEKYYRADCIVRINIDWSGYDVERRIRVQNDVFMEAAYAYHKTLGFSSPIPGPSSSFKGKGRKFYYLQFAGMCDQRYEFAENIITYFEEHFNDVPPMEVDPERFEPGRNTITVHGDSWIDGKPGYQPE